MNTSIVMTYTQARVVAQHLATTKCRGRTGAHCGTAGLFECGNMQWSAMSAELLGPPHLACKQQHKQRS